MTAPIWNRYAESAAERFGVPPALVNSVISVESGGQAGAVSGKGAGGYMQLMPDTFAELRQKHGLGPDRFDPETNINAGTAYIGQLYKQFGNWPDAIAAYNAGPNRWAQVKAGTRDAPRETQAYVPKVLAGFEQGKGTDVAMNRSLTEDQLLEFSRNGQMPGQTSLLNVTPEDMSKDYLGGMGNLLNFGQTPSQPPRTAAMPGTTQTDRMDVSGRINELLQQYMKQPQQRSSVSPLQYALGGMSGAVQPLAGVHDRKVGIGEMLGALGGGLTRGTLAGDEAQRADRANQIGELGTLGKIQQYQRGEATAASKVQAARQYAAELRRTGDPQKIAMAAAIENDPSLIDNVIPKQAEAAFPKVEPYTLAPGAQRRDAAGNIIADNPRSPTTTAPPPPVTLGDGPQGPGIYARNPDGTVGPRLGASETAPVGDAAPTLTLEQAQQAGLPPPPPNSPYSNQNLSPKGRSNLVAAQQKSWEKRAAANDEAVKSATSLVTDMERFKYLNSQTDTGGVSGSPVGSAVRSLYDSNVKEMNSIRDRITPTLRQPGSGATSDFDAKMFQGGTVGVDKPKQVNDNIATATIEGGKNLIAKAQFEQQYFDTYQHTGGMEAAWQKYLNDNPIFDPKAPEGSYTLNTNRVDWQTYFRNGGKVPERAPPASGGGSGTGVLRFDEKGNPIP